MRFKPYARHPYEVRARKRSGVLLSQRRQRDRHPLLAPLIAETQKPIDDVIEDRIARFARQEQEWRNRRAADWRRARARLAALPDNVRPVVLAFWNGHRWYPGDPAYLLDLLHGLEVGRESIELMQESMEMWALKARDFPAWAAKVRMTPPARLVQLVEGRGR
jgi:hypothetical protein